MKRLIYAAGALVLALPLLAETAIQGLQANSLPTYEANNQIGYIPKPNQSGSFLHMRDWAFNELSMGTSRPFRPDADAILLLGDSIVFGGTPYSEAERLGPQLEKAIGRQVWPAAAGSWALQNELTYLRQHPDIVNRVSRLVLILNKEDFGQPSTWRSEYTHPTHIPFPSLMYLMRRYVVRPATEAEDRALTVAPRDWRADFSALIAGTRTPVDVFLYPYKAECADPSELDTYGKILVSLGAARAINIGRDARWNASLYRDDVHPIARGNEVLAEIIAEALARN